ncbi:hypothetical protein QBC42DRAFT_12585 [Cladorrhinum samala]|uniref:Uncharacterized protein n=1 Tax=Cladorrhinum samala TaxID=585594 RepID=A0AAV9HDH0_9PEZI|nr:hypothetical protein QBC42DRAFT_12585 [Cladorrhinum samala]
MPIRNPFARRPGPAQVQAQQQDETNTSNNSRPGSAQREDPAHAGFERADTVGSKASLSSAWSIRSGRKSQDTGEYKMSGMYSMITVHNEEPPQPLINFWYPLGRKTRELRSHYLRMSADFIFFFLKKKVVNDSGIYLPPSPIEEKATWPKRYLSRQSSDKSSIVSGDIEHFPISRESFDSYRRSFDISAKSPVQITSDTYSRQSLDSSRHQYMSRSFKARKPAVFFPEDSEEAGNQSDRFEDVVLGDDKQETSSQQQQQQQQKKKGGFFSRLGHHEGGGESESGWGFVPGRKKAVVESGLAQELGAVSKPAEKRTVEVEV